MKLPKISSLVAISLLLQNCQMQGTTIGEILEDVESREFSGVILISSGNEVVHAGGYGFASCDNSMPNNENTVFAIGSITKMFTTATIALLHANGQLNADDAIGDYFPDAPQDKQEITIRQLLNHQSGLRTYHETTNLGDFESQSRDQALTEIWSNPLLFRPGTKTEYSNSGYTFLALLIERVTGQRYTDYVRQRLLIPAGMNSSGFWGEQFNNMASTANEIVGCSSPASWEYSWVLVGNGGMVSTAGDLKHWLQALKGDRLLDNNTKTEFGFSAMLSQGFGSAGGSSQHEFNATIEYSGGSDVLVVAISNTNQLPAEDFAEYLLQVAQQEIAN